MSITARLRHLSGDGKLGLAPRNLFLHCLCCITWDWTAWWSLTNCLWWSYWRPEGWDWGVLPPLHLPTASPALRGAPSPPRFRSAVLTVRLSGPAQEQVFHFLRRAMTFQQGFLHGLYFLRKELKRSPTVKKQLCLPAPGTAGAMYMPGKNPCRSDRDVKPCQTTWERELEVFYINNLDKIPFKLSWNERRVGRFFIATWSIFQSDLKMTWNSNLKVVYLQDWV